MARTTSEKIRVGVFVILGTAFLLVATYLIGNNESMFNKTFTISTVFKNVNGLQLGNNVRFSGINVGAVKAIEMENDTTIRVRMAIGQKMQAHIKKNAVATIGSDGLVGNMIVNIVPGKGDSTSIIDGDQISSYSRIGTADMLNTLNVTNENAALLTAKLLKVADALADGKGTFDMLINDTIMSANLVQTVNELRITSSEASKAMKSLNSMMSTINLDESVAGLLLNDTTETQKIRGIINNLETSSAEIESVLGNLNETLINIKDGEGAINYLSNDADFVESLEQIIDNINTGTDRFNENMEAMRHNFLTRGYFKKLERQEKRAARKKNN
jgi:phospholipid/cholesterol/gamma-HCH transport system substrate-binding protein